MKIVLVISIIIVLVVLLLTVLTTSKAYSYKHTIDELPKNDDNEASNKMED